MIRGASHAPMGCSDGVLRWAAHVPPKGCSAEIIRGAAPMNAPKGCSDGMLRRDARQRPHLTLTILLLSISQKEGVITLLPKGNKPRDKIKNWRPISLLNVSYKIISACVTNRIKMVLNNVINWDQKGFIKGRFIGDNIKGFYLICYHL